jgi:hypothetical protein
VQYGSTVFQKEPSFLGADFHKVKFIGCKFHSEVTFSMSRFREVYFSGVDFYGNANFDGARFQQAHFYNSLFHHEANFYQSVFEEAQFSAIEFKDESSFKFALFGKEDKILLDVKDLSKASFVNTDITGIRFGENVRWGTGENDFKIIDERQLEEELHGNSQTRQIVEGVKSKAETPNTIGNIITVYRNLRENYERSFRYEEADKFFIREMEVKRLYREKRKGTKRLIEKNGWFRRNFSLTGLYYWISEYGHNYNRPALLAIFFVSIPILYAVGQLYLRQGALTPEVVINATTTSLSNTFKIENQDVVGYFINIATVPILGALFIAALRRAFERRFRR